MFLLILRYSSFPVVTSGADDKASVVGSPTLFLRMHPQAFSALDRTECVLNRCHFAPQPAWVEGTALALVEACRMKTLQRPQ